MSITSRLTFRNPKGSGQKKAGDRFYVVGAKPGTVSRIRRALKRGRR